MQHVADSRDMMRRVIQGVDEEEETLREWVDNAVRGFEVGKRPDLVSAAKIHLDVILTRRKAAGEKNHRTSARHLTTHTSLANTMHGIP